MHVMQQQQDLIQAPGDGAVGSIASWLIRCWSRMTGVTGQLHQLEVLDRNFVVLNSRMADLEEKLQQCDHGANGANARQSSMGGTGGSISDAFQFSSDGKDVDSEADVRVQQPRSSTTVARRGVLHTAGRFCFEP